MGGYDQDDFQATMLALKNACKAYKAYSSAEIAPSLARGKRSEIQALFYPVLKQYRQRITSEFAEGSAILATLPRHRRPRLAPARPAGPDCVLPTR